MADRMTPQATSFVPSVDDLPLDDTCVVVADARLPQRLLSRMRDPLLVDAGEPLKTMESVERLADRVLARRASRPITLVGVGGGTVGDAVGFLSSILWRGVDLWHVPSTLLAMIDSAHGGKNAVNLGQAKNQLGTFHPAQRIFIVDELLTSMPVSVRRDGLAELLKIIWLADAPLAASISPDLVETWAFAPYEEFQRDFRPFMERAIRGKMEIVDADPREERGTRTVLNLGHTVAHAIELVLDRSHGCSVAWGLASMLELSSRFGLPPAAREQLHAQLFPLLEPLPESASATAMQEAIAKDKKQLGATLRSVVLQDAGRPLITDALTPDEWIGAFERVRGRFLATPVFVRLAQPRPVALRMDASKSELNRALVIAAMRPGRTGISGRSEADDVRRLVEGLIALGFPLARTTDGYLVDSSSLADPLASRTSGRCVDCGDGGTTFRFLLALACTSVKESRIYASPRLLERPHEPLLRALRSGGASITPLQDRHGRGYLVRGWERMPSAFSVDATDSSQFASAIALLAAGADAPFSLRLLGTVAGTSYLDMTLRMLESAGIPHLRNHDLILFDPTSRTRDAMTFQISGDESSAAVWRVARFLGHPVIPPPPGSALQPDAAIEALLSSLRTHAAGQELVLDVTDTPDLLPILAVAALHSRAGVRFTGAARLRHKESDRLGDFAASMKAIGVDMRASGDELAVHPSVPEPTERRVLRTEHDHRRAMAGALLALELGGIVLDDCWCVTKSYPRFWNDARMAGWSLRQDRG